MKRKLKLSCNNHLTSIFSASRNVYAAIEALNSGLGVTFVS
jgi:hypothetical protein